MQSEQERLEKLYAEMGDEHLLDMADDMDSLRDEARMALTAELRRRGIMPEPPESGPIVPEEEPEREVGFGAGVPGILPGGAAMMEQALEPAGEAKDGMSRLISFYDGIELSKACDLLEEADLEPMIEPIAGDAQGGVPPRFEIWVETDEIEAAKTLLRAKMGLFPAAEVDAEGFEEEAATGLVGVFESAEEADEIQALLAAQGMEAIVTQDEEDGTWQVTVSPQEQARAIAAVAEELGLG